MDDMRTATAILAVFLIAAGTNAQTPAERLARAIVIEENEHDVGQAIELYRALAQDAGADASTRDEASLRLGLALRRIGKDDESKAVLEALVARGGALAEQARTALQDPGDAENAMIREKVAQFVSRGELSLEDELVLLGAKAVPELIRAIAIVGRGGMPRPCRVLLRIGGEDVVAWLNELRISVDTWGQQSALVGFGETQSRTTSGAQRNRVKVSAEVRDALVAFLDHSNAEVRATAITELWSLVPAKRVFDAAGDGDPGVRRKAWEIIANRWNELRHESGEADSFEQLAPHLDRALSGSDPEAVAPALQAVKFGTRTPRGRALYLRAMLLPTFSWNTGFESIDNALPDELAIEVAATVRALGPVDVTPALGRSAPTQRQAGLGGLVHGLVWSWTDASRETVLLLLDNGYEVRSLVNFLGSYGRRDDIPQIARDLRRVPELAEGLLRWMAETGVPPAAFAPLREYLDDIVAGRLPKVSWVATALGTIDNEQSAAYLRALAFEQERVSVAVSGLVRGKSEPTRAVMRELLVLDSAHPGYRRLEAGYSILDTRAQLLGQLVKIGDVPTLDLLPRAYELGLGGGRGLRAVLSAKLEGWSEQTYNDDQIAHSVEVCLATKREDVWADLLNTNQWFTLGGSALEVIAKHALECPRGQRAGTVGRLLRSLGVTGRDALAAAVLTDPADLADDVRRAVIGILAEEPVGQRPVDLEPLLPVLQNLAKTNLASQILNMFARIGDARHAAFVRGYLSAEDYQVRRAAVDALIELSGSKAADDLLPLFESGKVDKDFGILSDVARKLLDRRFVPLLLAAMRRPGADHAKITQALEAIRFYEEQTAHWQRFLDGSNLDANSAAEALLKQAGRDNKRVIRLMAIGSLGALGAAETLPFLIDYTEDPDAEIAAAAKTAVTQIQLAKRPGK